MSTGVDTAPVPVLGLATDVWSETWGVGARKRLVVATRVEDDLPEWVPASGACSECGGALARCTDSALSGYCLRCLYGFPPGPLQVQGPPA